jgi:NAD(P)-dependent dehydrogenase (short-subunit alcohol dehydrogenase family)
MKDRVCVVTGATTGIGRATAVRLADTGAEVAVLGRNGRAGASVVSRINRRGAGQALFFPTDLAHFGTVRATAAELRRRYGAIDVLVNNAGARFDDYQTNLDGLERTFATNHLGHFLLTALLLESLLAAPAARIVTVGSGAHASTVGGDWMALAGAYDRKAAYARSKLANIVFAYELARRLQETEITSNAVDPGGVASNFARNNGLVAWLRHVGYYAMRRELRSPRRAASIVARVASADDLRRVSGKYFGDRGEIHSTAVSHERGTAASLWTMSLRLTGLDSGLGKAWNYFRP